VASAEGDGSDGHAEVLDADGRPLARGAYSPDSQIVARLWTFDARAPDRALFRERFDAAKRLREAILPSETTGYRAVNSEGDLCPAVLLDVYGDTAVLELLTAGTEEWRVDLEAAAREVFAPGNLVLRESGSARDSGLQSQIQDPKSEIPLAPFLENGLRFFADIASGQKTGFYLDQRDNRARLRALARGRSVLNLFAYTGAFSVAALAGGASRAVDVDSSGPALERGREHRLANGLPAPDTEFVEADVFQDLRRRVAAGERWDVVISDPPAFAKKRADVERAARGYKDINRLAMGLVAPDGWLLSCSCSGSIDAALFQKIVFSASADARVPFALTARQGAGADHPVSLDCPEGEYLKGLWLHRSA
jgi:23S rRNA (cytosine1962-C5)-methyltransferase